jgi:AcrR family transcriptional regulator
LEATASTGVRRKGAVRRQQILDVARSILIEAGLPGLVLRDVAERIGITHGNLQYYFATKEDLLVAIFDQEVQRYTRSMHDAVTQTSSKAARIAAIIDSAVSEIRGESTALWMMLFSLARQNEALCTILKDTYQLWDKSLAEDLAHVDPSLSPERRLHIAQMIRMLLDGLGVQAAYSDLSSPAMIALTSEMKAAVTAWFDMSTTG